MANEHETEGAIPEAEAQTHEHRAETRAPATAATEREMPDDAAELKRELERTRKALAAANKEAADKRRRIDEIDREKEAAKEKELTETQRLQKIAAQNHQKAVESEQRAAHAEKALVDTRISHAVEREAALQKATYPHLFPNMIDRSLVEYDPDSAEVRGAKKAVEKLLKECPGLAESYGGGGGTPSRTGPRQAGYGGDRAAPAPAPSPRDEMLATGGYSF